MPPRNLPFLLISIYLLHFLILSASKPLKEPILNPNSAHFSKKAKGFEEPTRKSIKLESLQRSQVILSGNTTIYSANKTFQLGFFNPGHNIRWYLGIWYASIPTPTYVWVANRENPIKHFSSAIAEISENGKLVVMDQNSSTILWETSNVEKASDLKLLEQGNLVLLNDEGRVVWQSFDFPTDTWLPGMNLTTQQWLTSWKSSSDPAPGRYSLRLNPPDYGEIALVYSNGSVNSSNSNSYTYWTTGKWNGNAFDGVPEMTIRYIYTFEFVNPFTPMAIFGYTESSADGEKPPLTRFVLDHRGQLKQFTWSLQIEYWNMFWSRPENLCRVYGLCGDLGFCSVRTGSPCTCLDGFRPVNGVSWNESDFSEGCHRESDVICGENEGFEEVGMVNYEGAKVVSFTASRSKCESECLRNCSCIGLLHNVRSNLCKNLYGSLFHIWNLTSDSTTDEKLYVKVPRNNADKKNKKMTVFIGMICGILVILSLGTINLLYLRRRKVKRRRGDEDGAFPVTNLRVFSYKELHAVTRGFSEKLGHGGFGAVFRGELSDSSLVAVKRLERPGGGEKEFRAEVSDFGLAKLVGRDFSRVLATMRGTWGYVAPEWISGVAITTKVDVYSYGMTLLELLGGRRNVEGPPSASGGGEGGIEKWFFPPWAASQLIDGNVTAVVDERLGSTYDKTEAERLGLVAVWCIQDDESMRPTMGMVLKMLEGVVEVAVPPPPKLLQALVSGDSFCGIGERVSQGDAPGSFNDNVLTSIDLKDSQSSM
ncbi:unnamed protein product [Fraxinus pennsylvanica]|uniref:Receptor-like serine/threonine-protein kinase n=1 Tax=Fraxinus pennsylvanica TaxID=56036 RepID=A0AAD2DR99_9LAMI|nr:unnamed protein product [Fraxinus pennsylvanica]